MQSHRQALPPNYVPSPPVPLGVVTGTSSSNTTFVGGQQAGPGGPTPGLYPRVVARPAGSAAPAGVTGPYYAPAGDIPIRVNIKPELLITPMAVAPLPQIPPPRNPARLDFDVERDFVVQAERAAGLAAATGAPASAGDGVIGMSGAAAGLAREAGGNGAAVGAAPGADLQDQLRQPDGAGPATERQQNGPSTAGTMQTNDALLDPAAAEYIAMGYGSDAVYLALATHSGTTSAKIVDFLQSYSQLAEMGFSPEAIAGALALYDNDLTQALAHLTGF